MGIEHLSKSKNTGRDHSNVRFFGGRMFQKTNGISMGTNCAPLHAELFLHTYEANFLQGFLKNKY